MNKSDVIVSHTPAHIGDAVVTLFRIGYSDRLARMQYGEVNIMHSHLYYECHLLLQGKTVFSTETEKATVCAGQLFIIPPDTEHLPFQSNADHGENAARELVLGMTLEKSDTGADSGYFSCFSRALNASALKPVALPAPIFHDFCRFWHQYDALQDLRGRNKQLSDAHALLFALFDTIHAYRLTESGLSHEQHNGIPLTMDYLVNEIQYSLSDIAQILGYSYRHTARLIRSTYGKSLEDLRQQQILASAKALLCSGTYRTLDSIAAECGCRSTHKLIRIFQKYEQMTPTEYRAAHGSCNNYSIKEQPI